MNAPFFLKRPYIEGVQKKIIYFSTGGPPPWHITPQMSVNTENIRYFARWGFLEEKVGRQGKVSQIVRNEPNYSQKNQLGP